MTNRAVISGKIYSPHETAQEVTRWVDRQVETVKSGNMLTWGVPMIDNEASGILPIYGGRMVIVLGRPGHGKSTMLQILAKSYGIRLMGRADDVIIYATFEQSPQELDLVFSSSLLPPEKRKTIDSIVRGKVPSSDLVEGLMERTKLPIWYFASSPEDTQLPDLDGLIEAIVFLRSQGKHVRAVFVDYAQIIPVRSSGRIAVMDKTASTDIVCQTLKRAIADTMRVPVVVAAQAGRQVDERPIPIPGLGDGQHASAIEQYADVLCSVMVPGIYGLDEIAMQNGRRGSPPGTYTVTPNTMVFSFFKQRQGAPSAQFILHVDWDKREMFPQERD